MKKAAYAIVVSLGDGITSLKVGVSRNYKYAIQERELEQVAGDGFASWIARKCEAAVSERSWAIKAIIKSVTSPNAELSN